MVLVTPVRPVRPPLIGRSLVRLKRFVPFSSGYGGAMRSAPDELRERVRAAVDEINRERAQSSDTLLFSMVSACGAVVVTLRRAQDSCVSGMSKVSSMG